MDWLHYNYYSRKVSNRSKISFQNYTLPSSRSSFPPPPPPRHEVRNRRATDLSECLSDRIFGGARGQGSRSRLSGA